ncbi:hypothetical protein BZA05DRAFT_413620 [Tricharina praecox]|uniref:uncharacterized protein n=1 Tax=Tricharina praecox TaxID=43433 RepID=UPI00221E732B|nr:uncharacterized protein BZA05DRAFT_413620 [Tricharina praecox]KAI5840957.1 hypothetical protein BZA05DRAFT_413620 [Tricharina praecox]
MQCNRLYVVLRPSASTRRGNISCSNPNLLSFFTSSVVLVRWRKKPLQHNLTTTSAPSPHVSRRVHQTASSWAAHGCQRSSRRYRYIWMRGSGEVVHVQTVLDRLEELLETGLKKDLHLSCLNFQPNVTVMILPEHLFVARYNQQQWREAVGRVVSEKECHEAAARCPEITPASHVVARIPAPKPALAPKPERTVHPLPQRPPWDAQGAVAAAAVVVTAGGTAASLNRAHNHQERLYEPLPASAPPVFAPSASLIIPFHTHPLFPSNPYEPHSLESALPKSLPPASRSTRSYAFSPSSSSALESATFPLHHAPDEDLLPTPFNTCSSHRSRPLLEDACHGFIGTYMTYLLEQKGWTIPQAAELHVYIRKIIPTWCGTSDGLDVLKALPQLRNSAVHRVRISSTEMGRFFSLAEIGATILGDNDANSKILRLSSLFSRNYIWPRQGREAVINMRERRLKHLEFVKGEIEKEELW